jgi:hypothetical protein
MDFHDAFACPVDCISALEWRRRICPVFQPEQPRNSEKSATRRRGTREMDRQSEAS